jgi:hypothetical protein
MKNKTLLLLGLLFCLGYNVSAHLPGKLSKPKVVSVQLRSICANSESSIDQEINNVRAHLLGGGDCWWDFTNGQYIVPKVDPTSGQEEVSSIFAASVWLGGIDPNGNLKLACQDYRTSGENDFWPGPLNENTGTTDEGTCKNWDMHFRVTSDDIRQHLANLASGNLNPDDIPLNLRGWPARGNPYFLLVHKFELPFNKKQGLAGFYDTDGDGSYEPLEGDYPSIEIRKCEPYRRYPDEMIFWIYNDEGAGATHGKTKGKVIQMEVQVQAFGYQTSDALNDMTFQRYKLVNRANDYLDSTYFAMWVDPDLGCYLDDYIGCDTTADLMYVYNQDEIDGQPGCNCPSPSGEVPTYCNNVPMLGVDYFRGPTHLVKKINDQGEEIDVVEEIGMSSFMYYNNRQVGAPNPATTDPELPNEFYNYITGSWKDGLPLTYGESGYNPGSTDFTKYALPSSPNNALGWSMCTADLPFGDRRTLQASGPFKLLPGTTNELIIGVPWVAGINQACPDIELLLRADKLAQGLFDNCFERLEGPDAPIVDWVELNQQLIAIVSNDTPLSNNKDESYQQLDFLAPDSIRLNTDPKVQEQALYKFEGYKIFQLINPNVSTKDFDDPDLARLVVQVDKKNNVQRIFNWEDTQDPAFPDDPKKKVFYPVEKVKGTNTGIRHSFAINEDQFSTGNVRALINHKKYYFAVVAYAHNNYAFFKVINGKETGQQNPYLEGGRVEIKTVIPRPIVDQVLHAAYGDGVPITRLEGEGIGHHFVQLDETSRSAMLEDNFNGEVTYLPGKGPINITIFNPFEIKEGDFELEFVDSNNTDATVDFDAHWVLRAKDDNGNYKDVATSTFGIDAFNEQLFAQYGFSVTIEQTAETGNYATGNMDASVLSPGKSNGAIGAEIAYKDVNNTWLSGISDQETGIFNFIKTKKDEKDHLLDPEQGLSKMGDGFFVPYPLVSGTLATGVATSAGLPRTITPAWTGKYTSKTQNDEVTGLSYDNKPVDPSFLRQLPNVDIVLTADPSKWSRCVVLESASEYYTTNIPDVERDLALITESPAGRLRQSFDTRYALSVGKLDQDGDGRPDPDNSVEPDSLPDPTPTDPNKKRLNPIKGQPSRGMGWFPGYAVNVETGERLNVFFGENSCYSNALKTSYTGRDMLWNPTDEFVRTDKTIGEVTDLLLGGQHWLYVTNTPYDACDYLRSRLNPDYWPVNPLKIYNKRPAMPQIAWAGTLTMAPGFQLKPLSQGLIPTETVVSLRVDNPYQVRVNKGTGHPKYQFRISGQAMQPLNDIQVANALDSIKAVPNPYYGFSQYETSSTSNVVKITNLPAKCIVTIYALNGNFIRQYKRDEQYAPYQQITPALEWDIKNNKGIPVASGVYIIHINAYGMGERTIKWFGITRMFDPSGL